MDKYRLPKTISYLYHLNVRNFKAYMRPMAQPQKQPMQNNSIHWVGHATTVINLNHKIIVTDPVIGNLGYLKRLVKPSMDLTSLRADYILLTHGHMDHLNYNVLMRMNKDATIIAPMGTSKILRLIGFKHVVNLKFGEEFKDNDIKVNCIGAKHDGRRYWLLGCKASNSYFISSKDKSVLFTGDTAHCENYKDVKADVAIMPVGCYKPDEYLSMHCSPEQSFEMFKMSKSKYMIPIHYKTYILAQDDDNETVDRLNSLNDGTIKIIDIGETVKI